MNTIFKEMVQKAQKNSRPFKITIELIRSCNLRCRHCYHGEFDNVRLPRETWQNILPQLAEAGTLELTFTGGEIFTHPDLIDIISDARKAYFDVTFISNLTLASEEQIAALAELGVRLVRTSLYFATAEKHDRFVGHKGAFAATTMALKLLRKYGIKSKVQVMLLDENISELAEIEQLCRDVGASCAGIYFMDPINRLKEAPPVEVPTLKTIEKYRENWQKSSFIGWMAKRQIGPELCGAATMSAFIDAEALLWPCINWPKAAGSLIKAPFIELWNGPVMQEARELLKKPTPCHSCEKRQFCAPCLGLNLKMGGGIDVPYQPRCRQAATYQTAIRGNKG